MPRLLPVLLTVLALLAVPAAAGAAPSQAMTFEAPNELLSDTSRDPTLDEILGLGVRRVRALVYWSKFSAKRKSAKPPSFDLSDPDAYPEGTWGLLDRLVAAADARGIELQLTLTGPAPDWATSKRNDGITKPSAKQFGRWATAVARRFGASVDLWSIWNEPNHPQFLAPQYKHGEPAAPGIYRDLYVAGERAVHGVPGGNGDKVLFGETAPVGNENLVEPLVFLRRALCLSSSYERAKGCRRLRMEGYAHHAYSRLGNPTFRSEDKNEVSIGSLD